MLLCNLGLVTLFLVFITTYVVPPFIPARTVLVRILMTQFLHCSLTGLPPCTRSNLSRPCVRLFLFSVLVTYILSRAWVRPSPFFLSLARRRFLPQDVSARQVCSGPPVGGASSSQTRFGRTFYGSGIWSVFYGEFLFLKGAYVPNTFLFLKIFLCSLFNFIPGRSRIWDCSFP